MTTPHAIPYSVLDLAWIPAGDSAEQALRRTRDLAVLAEQLGFNRYWVAEHHNMSGVACCATSLMLGYVAAATQRIRVGSGGIMLPNHAPLVVAEQFGTLDCLYPGRIDLGLGRAPGTDGYTVRALRRDPHHAADNFPQDVLELHRYFTEVDARVRAIPALGRQVPLWMLGSSTYGAQVAAALGLPHVFASHFAPQALHVALQMYREQFQPSEQLDKPYVMVCAHVYCAETESEAQFHASTLQQMFHNLHRGTPKQLQPPREDFLSSINAQERASIDQTMQYSAIGTPEQVQTKLRRFAEVTQADELMIAAPFYHQDARLRSYELLTRNNLHMRRV